MALGEGWNMTDEQTRRESIPPELWKCAERDIFVMHALANYVRSGGDFSRVLEQLVIVLSNERGRVVREAVEQTER